VASYPDDLEYTAEHEWIRRVQDGALQIGITDHAQDALGDIVFVSLPAVGDRVTAGSPCGEVESTKSVSDVYSPVDGEVIARNDAVETSPETINADPYGAWLFTVRADGDAAHFLTADAYRTLAEA
jgi:glycine cleavage system H protein